MDSEALLSRLQSVTEPAHAVCGLHCSIPHLQISSEFAFSSGAYIAQAHIGSRAVKLTPAVSGAAVADGSTLLAGPDQGGGVNGDQLDGWLVRLTIPGFKTLQSTRGAIPVLPRLRSGQHGLNSRTWRSRRSRPVRYLLQQIIVQVFGQGHIHRVEIRSATRGPLLTVRSANS